MLILPEVGLYNSIDAHNSDLSIATDWVEASILFCDDEVSKVDIVDILTENGLYRSQDFAKEFVNNIWTILDSRIAALNGALGLNINRNRITRERSWEEFPAYAFCLALSCASYIYPRWGVGLGRNFSEQGALFELLAKQSLKKMLPGWIVKHIGWTPEHPVRLHERIDEIISLLNEVKGAEIDTYINKTTKELGLDLLATLSFGDKYACQPFLMVQCASGKNWEEKRHTPSPEIWGKIISFNSVPVKGFAMPFSFTSNEDFRIASSQVNGIFLDRYRLLNPLNPNRNDQNVWDDLELNTALANWVRPKIDSLLGEIV